MTDQTAGMIFSHNADAKTLTLTSKSSDPIRPENQATSGAYCGRIVGVAPEFVPGLQLAREFCGAVVRPLLEESFPRLTYAAALLGPGSEVVGFDSQRSTDHDWGPRLQVFLTDGDAVRHAGLVTAMLASRLPASFRGYPVAFPITREPGGIARHRVEVTGLGTWLTSRLGFDPRHAVTLLDWLATPAQRLAEITTGEVFHDGPGELSRARAALAWYPHDVWLYVLACQWQRIGQEEPFPGRCAEIGDDLGSALAGSPPRCGRRSPTRGSGSCRLSARSTSSSTAPTPPATSASRAPAPRTVIR